MMISRKNSRLKSNATAAHEQNAPQRSAAAFGHEAIGQHVGDRAKCDRRNDRKPLGVGHERGDVAVERATENEDAISGEGKAGEPCDISEFDTASHQEAERNEPVDQEMHGQIVGNEHRQEARIEMAEEEGRHRCGTRTASASVGKVKRDGSECPCGRAAVSGHAANTSPESRSAIHAPVAATVPELVRPNTASIQPRASASAVAE
jgi:hypothetical protein